MCKLISKFSIFLITIFFSSAGFAMFQTRPVTRTVTSSGDMYSEIMFDAKGGYFQTECQYNANPKPSESKIMCTRVYIYPGFHQDPIRIGDQDYNILKSKYEAQQKKSDKNEKPAEKPKHQQVQYSPINALIKR